VGSHRIVHPPPLLDEYRCLGPLKWYSITESGYRQTIPELQVQDRAFQVLLKLGTRFGLDPSSREGLGVADQTSPNGVSVASMCAVLH
jgi:hypothetical protein